MTRSILKSSRSLALLLCAGLVAGANADVVDVDAGASDTQAYYANWAASGADAANPPAESYNNYRKGGVSLPNPGLPVVANNADGNTATWTNISHGGSLPCCGNPGMFFGSTPSSSSYASSTLFVRDNTEAGNAHDFDSNGRRRFDLRFGFTESPSDWLDGKAANSGQMDLWTGDHGSDTVYLQSLIGATDDALTQRVPSVDDGGNLIDQTNQYVAVNQDLLAQSGASTLILDERDRDRFYSTGVGISTSEMFLDDLGQPDLGTFTLQSVGLNNSAFDTGVAYDGDVSIKWWMELNDPDATPGTLEAREVKFSYQAGDVVFSQTFDPGDASNPVTPNPSLDSGNTFEDGFFDWQNAYPVFFMGPSGGATPAGSMTMGFTSEVTGLLGDFDGNGSYECGDVDALVAEIAAGTNSSAFDMTDDGNVDGDDLMQWLSTAGEANLGAGKSYLLGDANLDGTVDVSDFNVWNSNKFTNTAAWCSGDFTADGVVDVSDFNNWNTNKFTSSDVSSVPEPSSLALLLLSLPLLRIFGRKSPR